MIGVKLIRDILAVGVASGKPVVSFEFFPPKTEEGERVLFQETLPELMKLNPGFCSVTFGAGGSTRTKTLGIVDRIQREYGLPTMAHLTCVGSTQEEIRVLLDQIQALGIRNLLALRGDPPVGTTEFRKTEGGFEYAADLVRFIRTRGEFSIGVAGFPEGHVACKEGRETDWHHLAAKVSAGADFVVTQLFYDNADYFAFRDFLQGKLGIHVPLIPGVLPVHGTNQIKKFAALCGARLPAPLLGRLESLGDQEEAVREYGVEYATAQCREMLAAKAPGVHFYTLNKVWATRRVVEALGLQNGR